MSCANLPNACKYCVSFENNNKIPSIRSPRTSIVFELWSIFARFFWFPPFITSALFIQCALNLINSILSVSMSESISRLHLSTFLFQSILDTTISISVFSNSKCVSLIGIPSHRQLFCNLNLCTQFYQLIKAVHLLLCVFRRSRYLVICCATQMLKIPGIGYTIRSTIRACIDQWLMNECSVVIRITACSLTKSMPNPVGDQLTDAWHWLNWCKVEKSFFFAENNWITMTTRYPGFANL